MYTLNNKYNGLATIEMAVTLPILLLLMVSAAELGRVFYQYNTLTKATQGAVRHLADIATNGTTGLIQLGDSKVLQIKNLVVYANTAGAGDPLLIGLDIDDVSVSSIDANHIQVNTSYTYNSIFLSIPTFGLTTSSISTNFTLNTTSTMRAL